MIGVTVRYSYIFIEFPPIFESEKCVDTLLNFQLRRNSRFDLTRSEAKYELGFLL